MPVSPAWSRRQPLNTLRRLLATRDLERLTAFCRPGARMKRPTLEAPRVATLWRRKDQTPAPGTPGELVMVTTNRGDTIGFAPVRPLEGRSALESLLALNLFLEYFAPVNRATDGRARARVPNGAVRGRETPGAAE